MVNSYVCFFSLRLSQLLLFDQMRDLTIEMTGKKVISLQKFVSLDRQNFGRTLI